MDDFKSTYQSAMQDVKEFHIDVSNCMDESRHRRRVVKRAQKATATAFSAMCVIFVCGFGSVKAAEYFQNVIRVNEWGFESGDAFTMSKGEAAQSRSYVVEEAVEKEKESPMLVSSQDESFIAGEIAGENASAEMQMTADEANIEMAGVSGNSVTGNSAADSPASTVGDSERCNSVTGNSVSGDRGANASSKAEKPVSGNMAQTDGTAKNQLWENGEVPVYHYVTWEEFIRNEDIIFPQPSISIGKKVVSTEVTVCGSWAMVRYEADDKVLWMERTDYSDTKGHESSKIFPGGVTNEREYTTSGVYTYKLVDSVKEKDSDKLQIHAAITVGSYEVYIDFLGFTESDAKKIMDNIDLKQYE
ncbi:hypothetical protein EDD76_11580 [Kineothrix alysoides]|uniref:DUF4367 domain-containing protein n=1 Tax=Kineothrix alysoides TaxID=1469948 RepID=A0A4R1QQ03_9FIRM|nr:hypothetical protein [Kineothrix alysoides]TCL55447.1 hypothetical protein EDD76_11580 [Kineothrix alysoides]